MKLLYITNQICGAGGLERVLSIKTDYLVKNFNYDIHIVTLNQNNEPLFYDFNNKISYHDIIVKKTTLKYVLSYIKGIRKVIKQLEPDVISVCDDGLKGFFLPIILNKPCPMIYERHVSRQVEIKSDKTSLKEKLLTFIKFKLMHLGGNLYDKFVVLTKQNLDEWSLNNLTVISNPLSFYPNESSSLENKVVIAVGKQSYQKGYDRLLESWKMIFEKYPDWQLKIFGSINKSLKLEEQTKLLGINNNVLFYKPTKEIVEEYLNASIYVLSSRFEGFGMVLIEAMACGLPVVSFDCPCGPKDIITNEVDGYLLENGNIDELANKLNTLISDFELRKQMGVSGRRNSTKYLPENIVPQWDLLFQELIKKHK